MFAISVSGVHGSGKTTFIRELSHELTKLYPKRKPEVLHSFTREVMKEQGWENGEEGEALLPAYCSTKRAEKISEYGSYQDPLFLISDRCAIDERVYAELTKGGEASLPVIEECEAEENEFFTFRVLKRMPSFLELEDDGVRPQDEEFHRRVGERFDEIFRERFFRDGGYSPYVFITDPDKGVKELVKEFVERIHELEGDEIYFHTSYDNYH